MNRHMFLLTAAIAVATLATVPIPVAHHAVWNVSASTPTGLYLIRGKQSLHVGERIAIKPPSELRRVLAERGYLPVNVPLIKRVAAVRGQLVCRFAHGITVDGVFAGVARARDRQGRPLPAWSGCHRLQAGDIFVMNVKAPGSFDGRYFGVLKINHVIGRAMPVWTDEAGDGRHVWFADAREIELSTTTSQGE